MKLASLGLVLSLGAGVAVRAHFAPQGQGQGGGTPAPEVIPTSAASIVAHPANYLGHTVTMAAYLEKQLTPTVFTVDQDRTKTLPGDVLVIAPSLNTAPAANTFLTIIGPAVAFDPADVAKRLSGYTLDLSADLIDKYRGKPAVLATAVVLNDMTDIAKKKPAPMTPDDEKLTAIMKQVNPAATALRTAAGGSDAAAVKTRTDELKKLFTDAQAVFKGRNMTDAVNWSADAVKFADSANAAAAAGKWPDVTAAAGSLNGLCGSCHTAHRERMDDGTYRLKGE